MIKAALIGIWMRWGVAGITSAPDKCTPVVPAWLCDYMGVGFAGCLFQCQVWVTQNWERPVGSATTAFQREGPSFPGELLVELR